MGKYRRLTAPCFRQWRFLTTQLTIRPDHQPMAYGTWDNIEPEESYHRSFCSRRRMVAHRIDRYSLFADGDRSIRHEDNGVGLYAAKLVDRAKHDGCLCRDGNSLCPAVRFRRYT